MLMVLLLICKFNLQLHLHFYHLLSMSPYLSESVGSDLKTKSSSLEESKLKSFFFKIDTNELNFLIKYVRLNLDYNQSGDYCSSSWTIETGKIYCKWAPNLKTNQVKIKHIIKTSHFLHFYMNASHTN